MSLSLRISQNSHTPIQTQITERIGTLIRTGKVKPGAILPSVRQAAKQWGVNFSTVSRAYSDLKNEGLIAPNKSRRMEVAAVQTLNQSDRAALLRPAILGLKTKARELGLTEAQFHAEVYATLGMTASE
ncbi:GntR family transcriptional regulator [Xanthomonas hydrangeae]|uniref:GntR family transcriptional regulator n=1 Tax=Xanthomonas hydrangeae TaxID=2775159 RepID=UPI0019632E75